ncbi:MAG TPA: ankyrin repeat domain-containing protein [Acidobacteriaceae bacterium]
MSKSFLDLVKRGDTQEIADWVKDDPQIAESRDAQGVSALLWAVYSGQTVVREFLRSGLEPDLAEAAAVGDVARLRELLGSDPAAVKERANSRSADGWPLLHLAAAFADRETVALLLDAGADVRQISGTPMRNQALHAALALSKNVDVVRLLIERGADVNAAQTAGYRPLHQAAVTGREDLVRMLLDAGADKLARCDRGKAPAEYARERGHAEVAAMLE